MKYIVAGHQALSDAEFAELALGTPVELWLGVEGESEEERAARTRRATFSPTPSSAACRTT
jgi:hypothetical protein